MKKSSYAIILSFVLLVAVAAPLVSATGMDNNILLSAISNGVTTILNAITSAKNVILNAITNSQGNITANTDADTNALAPKYIVIQETRHLPPGGNTPVVEEDLLPIVQDADVIFSGHVTISMYANSTNVHVALYPYLPLDPDNINVLYLLADLSTGGTTDFNGGFSGLGLKMRIFNEDLVNSADVVIYGVIQYTSSTSGNWYFASS